jgi:Ser-tRNA(Ala) deacylase AlaX
MAAGKIATKGTKLLRGGTHLRKTGEIGEIELKRKNVGKGKERIEIYVSENSI